MVGIQARHYHAQNRSQTHCWGFREQETQFRPPQQTPKWGSLVTENRGAQVHDDGSFMFLTEPAFEFLTLLHPHTFFRRELPSPPRAENQHNEPPQRRSPDPTVRSLRLSASGPRGPIKVGEAGPCGFLLRKFMASVGWLHLQTLQEGGGCNTENWDLEQQAWLMF